MGLSDGPLRSYQDTYRARYSLHGGIVDRRPAISWAAAGGFVEIVDMFLSHDGSLINVKDEGKG